MDPNERVYLQQLDRNTITAILKDHVEHDLSPQDRQALSKASGRFVLGISLGGLVGGTLAASLPFRGRYALRNLRSLPPLYPEGRLDRQLAAEHLRFVLRSFLFFSGGAIAGSQLGGFLGLRSAQNIIRSEGSTERINQAIQNTRDDLRRRSAGGPSARPQYNSNSGDEPQDGENTPLAEQWQSEQESSQEDSPPSFDAFQDPNAPPQSVGELLIASQQPAARQDFQVFQSILGRISTLGSLAMSAGWFAGLSLSLVGPFGLRWIQKRHGSFLFRAGMSQSERTSLLKSQLAWAAKLSIFSLVGLQIGANIGGPKALDKAWTEAMQDLRDRPDGDEIKNRLQLALYQARHRPARVTLAPPRPSTQPAAPNSTMQQSVSGDGQSQQSKSRWEELRNTGKPDSAWDRIRQQNQQNQAQQNKSQEDSRERSKADKLAEEKEAFQRMLDAESQGKDTSFR